MINGRPAGDLSIQKKCFDCVFVMKTRIGVLTSGGDCPGLNAVLRGVVLAGEKIGWEVIGRAKKVLDELRVKALIIVGGDGSMTTAMQMQKAGINCIGVPKTIDNDSRPPP